jgi:hypothetical protein
VEPRIPRMDIHQVACENGRWVFIIRVARTWIGPVA